MNHHYNAARGMAVMLVVLGLLFPLTARPAKADLGTLTFSSPVISAHAGDTITFSGFIKNLQLTSIVLGGDNVPVLDPKLINFDDTPYFNNLSSATVAAGATTPTSQLFSLQVDPLASIGSYSGKFEVLEDTTNAIVGSGTFTVNVVSNIVVLPEPSTLLFALMGVPGALCLIRRRKV